MKRWLADCAEKDTSATQQHTQSHSQLLRRHCVVTASSLRRHCVVTASSLRRHCVATRVRSSLSLSVSTQLRAAHAVRALSRSETRWLTALSVLGTHSTRQHCPSVRLSVRLSVSQSATNERAGSQLVRRNKRTTSHLLVHADV